MLGSIALSFITFLLRKGAGEWVNRGIKILEDQAALRGEQFKIESQVEIEAIKAAVAQTAVMIELEKQKLDNRAMWWFIGMFVVPLGLWWMAVIADGLPYVHLLFGDQQVADLPTEDMREWAGRMIQWLFYVGTSAVALRFGLR